MILYHGSNIDITDIDLSQSKVGKDFGCGFYLSADKEQALALAKRKTEQIGTGNPVLNVYEFDETNLQSADLICTKGADKVLHRKSRRVLRR